MLEYVRKLLGFLDRSWASLMILALGIMGLVADSRKLGQYDYDLVYMPTEQALCVCAFVGWVVWNAWKHSSYVFRTILVLGVSLPLLWEMIGYLRGVPYHYTLVTMLYYVWCIVAATLLLKHPAEVSSVSDGSHP